MKTDDNWKETRLLAKDILDLTGVPIETTEHFLELLEDLIIHRFLEMVLSDNSNEDTDYSIELPYLGTLVLAINPNNNNISTSFNIRKSLYKKIKSAYNSRISPLTCQIEENLKNRLVKKFEEEDYEDE